MSVTKFLDTNVLLYAYNLGAPAKRAVALKIVEQAWATQGAVAISVQVLQEMHVNLVKRGVSQEEAGQLVRDYSQWAVVENTLDLLLSALDEQVRWKISLWDSLILAAARSCGAPELITEDFNHGQDYNGVRAINPFR
jgi:predicted nucleic acid-binding protein